MTDTFRVGEFGKPLKVETGQDLSGFALGDLSLLVQKPDGTAVTWAAGSTETGEAPSSIIVYNLVTGDLNLRGNYILHSDLNSTSPLVHEIGEPTVLKVLDLYETTR